MPVKEAVTVTYDCNVSLEGDGSGRFATPTATVLVEMPDGMEATGNFEERLKRAIIKKLKIVAFSDSVRNTVTPFESYVLEVNSPHGYCLGRTRVSLPFVTAWDGTPVSMQNYMPMEAEGWVEKVLQKQLVVRINQRTPPLPRTEPDEKGQRPDVVYSFDSASHTVVKEEWEYVTDLVRAERERQERLRREKLLADRMIMDPLRTQPGYAPPEYDVHARLSEFAALLGEPPAIPDSLRGDGPQDVAKRASVTARQDVATRYSSYGRDVAEMGEELDL